MRARWHIALLLLIAGGAAAYAEYTSTPRANINAFPGVVSVMDAPFGALCDGATDDTAALQLAVNSGASTVLIPPAKTCTIGSVGGVTLAANVEIAGSNRFTSIIKLTVNPTAGMFTSNSVSGWAFRNITLDYNNKVAGGNNGVIDSTSGSNDWVVDKVRMLHVNKFGITTGNNSDFLIQDSYVQKDTPDPSSVNAAFLLTGTGGVNRRGRIYRNRIVNIGLGGSAVADSYFVENFVDGPGYGSGMSMDYGVNGAKNNVVSFNNVKNGSTALGFDNTIPIGIENYSYNTVGVGNIVDTMGAGGIHNGGGWNTWAANITVNNDQRSLVVGCVINCQAAGFEIRRVDNTTNSQFSAIVGNVSANNFATPSQAWAFAGINDPVYTFMTGNVAMNGVVAPVALGVGLYQSAIGPALSPITPWTYDPPNLAAGASATTTQTLAGAALGDIAHCSFSLDTQGIVVSANVPSATNVAITFFNATAGALNLASGTITCNVYKPKTFATF